MQIFVTLEYLILQKKKFKPASADIGPLVHTVYSERTTSHIQKNERGVCGWSYCRKQVAFFKLVPLLSHTMWQQAQDIVSLVSIGLLIF